MNPRGPKPSPPVRFLSWPAPNGLVWTRTEALAELGRSRGGRVTVECGVARREVRRAVRDRESDLAMWFVASYCPHASNGRRYFLEPGEALDFAVRVVTRKAGKIP